MLVKFYMPFAHEFTKIKKRNRIYLTIWVKNSKGKKKKKNIYIYYDHTLSFNLNASLLLFYKCANKSNVIQFKFNLKVN